MVALPVEPPQRFECIVPTYAGKRNSAVNIGKWMFRPQSDDRCASHTPRRTATERGDAQLQSSIALRLGPALSVSAADCAPDRQAPAGRAGRGRIRPS
jgi:hypothetical protein